MSSDIITPARIAEIFTEASTFGAGKLSGNEHRFLRDINAQAQAAWFRGLSAKQAVWFRAIAKKLEATKGKPAFEVIASRHQEQGRYYRDSRNVAFFGR